MDIVKDISLRYTLALMLGLSLSAIYLLLKPATVWLSYHSLNLFVTDSFLSGNKIITPFATLNFIDACIAASAYLLLGILVLTTRGIRFRSRLSMFIIGSILILSFNIIRITVLAYILSSYGSNLFNSVHMVFWKVLSTLYVFFVWILLTYLFNVIHIPIVSDFKELKKHLYNT
jgi:exosortase/archaeosortase family protein